MPGIPVLIILLHCYSVYDLFETKIFGFIFIFRSLLIEIIQVLLNNADNQTFFDILNFKTPFRRFHRLLNSSIGNSAFKSSKNLLIVLIFIKICQKK